MRVVGLQDKEINRVPPTRPPSPTARGIVRLTHTENMSVELVLTNAHIHSILLCLFEYEPPRNCIEKFVPPFALVNRRVWREFDRHFCRYNVQHTDSSIFPVFVLSPLIAHRFEQRAWFRNLNDAGVFLSRQKALIVAVHAENSIQTIAWILGRRISDSEIVSGELFTAMLDCLATRRRQSHGGGIEDYVSEPFLYRLDNGSVMCIRQDKVRSVMYPRSKQ